MKKIASVLTCFILVLFNSAGFAQDAEMADGMRASGKIYVVVGIILIVLMGLIVYLFRMDKKLNQLEKQLDDHRKPKRV